MGPNWSSRVSVTLKPYSGRALVLPGPEEPARPAMEALSCLVPVEPQKGRVSKPRPVPERWLPYLQSEGEDARSGGAPARLDSVVLVSIWSALGSPPAGKLG